MATAVQIELMVDEKGALQGIRSFDTSVKGASGSVRKLNSELHVVGGTAARSGIQAKAATESVGVASLSSVEKVRLLTEEFGIRLPRAMVNMAAESKAVQASINAISGGLLALGAIQVGAMVFSQLIDGAEKLWHNVLNVNAAVEDYNAELEKAKNQDFGNTRSIETTRQRIAEARAEIEAYRAAADALDQKANHSLIHALDPAAPYMTWQAHELRGSQMDWQRKLDELERQREPEQQHQGNLDRIELQHAGDARLRGEQKITAELEKQRQINAENARYERAQEGALGNPVGKGGLWETGHLSKENTEDLKAQAAADADLFNLRRAQAQELRRIHEEALESGLRGSALFHAQEAFAIEDLKQKGITSSQAINDVKTKFHNEEMKRLEQEGQAADKALQAALVTGKTGIAKIQAQGASKIEDISKNGPEDPIARLKLYAAANYETNQQILQAEQEFTDRTNQLSEASADKQVAGFARIRREADRQIEAARKDFEKLYQTPELQQAHAGELNARVGAINAGAGIDATELAHRNADETLQIEMEARQQSLSAEKQQTLAIQAEYDSRLAKYQDQLKQQEISEDDYNRRVLAAGQLRDAKLEESARQAREKMATEFSRFFSNPMQALKEFGDKAAGQAAAALMQRIQNPSLGGRPGGEESGGLFGGIMDHIAGIPKLTRSADHRSELASSHASTGLLTINAAQIRIGSASIVAAGGRGGGFISAGSTSLLGGGRLSNALYQSGGESDFGGAADFGTAGGGGGFAGGGSTFSGSSTGGGFNSVLGGVDQGVGLFKQAKSIFAPGGGASGDLAEVKSLDLSGSFDKAGNFNLGKSGSGLFNGGGLGAVAGAAGGAMGLFSAFEGSGGAGGMLSGAMGGMQLGMMVGGPIGAAVGAAAGAVMGAFGFGGKEKARVYDLKTVQPRITQDLLSYQQGSMDYTSAYSDLDTLSRDARTALRAMGSAGDHYYWDTVKGEIAQAQGKLTAEERAGRSHFHATAAQFDVGSDSIPHDGFAFIHAKERIFPSDQNERITRALEAGASSESIARGYRAAMSASSPRGWGGSGDRTVNMNFHALDSKSVARMFNENKHHLRAALNASYAENSGGADA